MNEKQLRWYNIALMAFVSVWGLGNVVNNYAQQGLTVVVSWLLIMALYFVPYALSVGQLGSTFKESSGGFPHGSKKPQQSGWLFCCLDLLGRSRALFGTKTPRNLSIIKLVI